MKIKNHVFLLFTISLMMWACQKTEFNAVQRTTAMQAQAWLAQNGGAYKSGTMRAQLRDSSFVTGKLDWSNTNSFTTNGQNYVSVPFVFEKVGTNIPMDNWGAYTQYKIVFREKGDSLEAALQQTLASATLTNTNTNTNGRDIATLQTYYTLSGAVINSYIRKISEQTKSVAISPAVSGTTVYGKSLPAPSMNMGGGSGTLAISTAALEPSGGCTTYMYNYEEAGESYSLPDGTVGVTAIVVPAWETVCDQPPSVTTTPTPSGAGGGGTAANGVTPTYLPDIPDTLPCDQIKPIALQTTSTSQTAGYTTRLNAVVNATPFTVEHSVALNNNAGTVTAMTSQMTRGGSISVQTPPLTNTSIATVHTHVSGLPPSAGDVYDLISLNSQYPNYTTSYVTLSIIVSSNNDVYALVVTNSALAKAFAEKYPESTKSGGCTRFPWCCI